MAKITPLQIILEECGWQLVGDGEDAKWIAPVGRQSWFSAFYVERSNMEKDRPSLIEALEVVMELDPACAPAVRPVLERIATRNKR